MQIGRGVLLVGAMLVLAGLDIAGSLLAKQFAVTHRLVPLLLGAGLFVLLFVVYALSLQVAELSIVTLGWIVLLQVGLLLVDARDGMRLQAPQWVAVALVLGLQCYLVASTAGPDAGPVDHAATADALASAVVPQPRRPPADGPLPTAYDDDRPTPYLDMDLDVVARRYEQLSEALQGVALHYAVKANPAPEVLELLVQRGASFDVASPGEIAACLRAGARPADLSYGNTVKKERDMAAAYAQGVGLFTFDDEAELAKLVRAAPGATLCCRLTTSGDGADYALSHKFGCPPDRALRLLAAAAAAGHPVGVAFHVGSQQRDPRQWEEPLRQVGRYRRSWRRAA